MNRKYNRKYNLEVEPVVRQIESPIVILRSDSRVVPDEGPVVEQEVEPEVVPEVVPEVDLPLMIRLKIES